MTPYLADPDFTLYNGDVLEVLASLPAESVHTVVTSPPYWGLRDYGVAGQIGLEPTPEAYVARMVAVFREVRRVLRSDGTCWLNIGDTYNTTASGRGGPESSTLMGTPNVCNPSSARRVDRFQRGLPAKNLLGIPWRLAFAMQADGWILRAENIWWKVNVLPENATDRPHRAHEHVFLFAQSARYFYDADAVKEPAKWDRWGGQTPRKTDDDRARGAQFVAQRVGHADGGALILRRYRHLFPSEVERALSLVDGILGGVSSTADGHRMDTGLGA